MEYVIVRFEEEREVFVDGESCGQTGEVLLIEKGTHQFKLGDPQDYAPKWRRPVVKDTSSVEPMEVTFEKA